MTHRPRYFDGVRGNCRQRIEFIVDEDVGFEGVNLDEIRHLGEEKS